MEQGGRQRHDGDDIGRRIVPDSGVYAQWGLCWLPGRDTFGSRLLARPVYGLPRDWLRRLHSVEWNELRDVSDLCWHVRSCSYLASGVRLSIKSGNDATPRPTSGSSHCAQSRLFVWVSTPSACTYFQDALSGHSCHEAFL